MLSSVRSTGIYQCFNNGCVHYKVLSTCTIKNGIIVNKYVVFDFHFAVLDLKTAMWLSD